MRLFSFAEKFSVEAHFARYTTEFSGGRVWFVLATNIHSILQKLVLYLLVYMFDEGRLFLISNWYIALEVGGSLVFFLIATSILFLCFKLTHLPNCWRF